MESATYFEGKGEESHWQGKGAGKDGAKSSGQANAQKIQGRCWNCGNTGHQSKNCWARPQQQQSQGQSNSPGKGNDVKGTSKVEERKASPKMLEHLFGISKLEVQLRARWSRLERLRTPLVLEVPAQHPQYLPGKITDASPKPTQLKSELARKLSTPARSELLTNESSKA